MRRPEQGIGFVASGNPLSLSPHKRLAPSLKLKKKITDQTHKKNYLYKFSKDFRTGTNYAEDTRLADTSERQGLRVTDPLQLTGRYVTLGTAFSLSSTSVVPSSATLILCFFFFLLSENLASRGKCESSL